MMRSLNTAASGMAVQQRNLDTIANNLANVNTTGFKSQRAEFQDLMYQTIRASGAQNSGSAQQPAALQVGLGSQFVASTGNFGQGAAQQTGSQYDLMITGDGFFKIEMPDGSTAYTRDGSFKVNANNEIVTTDGYPLSPAISIPAGATAVFVSSNGTVSAKVPGQDEPQELGTITLTVFPNPAGLTRIGQNLFSPGGASGTGEDRTPGQEGAGQIVQGALESSNVEIVFEMVRMITAQRAYEINSKAIQTSDDMLGILNNLKR
jgi:flagellar basal-body rod protein FlgG